MGVSTTLIPLSSCPMWLSRIYYQVPRVGSKWFTCWDSCKSSIIFWNFEIIDVGVMCKYLYKFTNTVAQFKLFSSSFKGDLWQTCICFYIFINPSVIINKTVKFRIPFKNYYHFSSLLMSLFLLTGLLTRSFKRFKAQINSMWAVYSKDNC